MSGHDLQSLTCFVLRLPRKKTLNAVFVGENKVASLLFSRCWKCLQRSSHLTLTGITISFRRHFHSSPQFPFFFWCRVFWHHRPCPSVELLLVNSVLLQRRQKLHGQSNPKKVELFLDAGWSGVQKPFDVICYNCSRGGAPVNLEKEGLVNHGELWSCESPWSKNVLSQLYIQGEQLV